jgi:hypothetical protein
MELHAVTKVFQGRKPSIDVQRGSVRFSEAGQSIGQISELIAAVLQCMGTRERIM